MSVDEATPSVEDVVLPDETVGDNKILVTVVNGMKKKNIVIGVDDNYARLGHHSHITAIFNKEAKHIVIALHDKDRHTTKKIKK